MVFVQDIGMEEALKAVAGMKEFRVKRCDTMGYTILNYNSVRGTTFPNPKEAGISEAESRRRGILRECRGLIFHTKTGEVIARRYHKFFNVGEKAETNPTCIDLSDGFHVLDKLDGQLASPFLINDEVFWGTKMGVNKSSDIEKIFIQFNPNYNTFSRTWLEKGMTPLFEWCSPATPIVIRHSADKLVLTAIRCNKSGAYMPFEQMMKAASEHNVDCVTPLLDNRDVDASCVSELVKKIDPMKNTEGCVIVLKNGLMYKVKTSWYRALATRSKASGFQYTQEADVWESILSGTIDDNTPLVPADKVQKLQDYTTLLLDSMSVFSERHIDATNEFIKKLSADGRKSAVGFVNKKYPKNPRSPSVNSVNLIMQKFLLGLKPTNIPKGSFTPELLQEALTPLMVEKIQNTSKYLPLDVPKWVDYMYKA
eukprot:TRINITY_DN1832_c1_g1_i1.p1 TRINITY_DN1832_c1_g1~~TRINITY_DN1832_c1_g1_i1.p1  ORF type:complete len:444 (+),score=76.81 TRINITY_DN1832_c1_g1_i1:59-1333(+)